MRIVCLDLEGVLIPEIWIALAEHTGIDALRATTRDVPDYDVLMRQRLEILDEHSLGIGDIHQVIDGLEPLPGAPAFLDWLQARNPVILLSDTYYEFAEGLMPALGNPTLFCHSLEIDGTGRIADYKLRLADHKRHTVAALKALNFEVLAVGDSYNDTNMLIEADAGILFRAPDRVVREFPQFPVVREYAQLRDLIDGASEAVA